MKKLKNKAFGRDLDLSSNEIDLPNLKGWKDRVADNVMSQETFLVFPLGRFVFFVLSLTQRAIVTLDRMKKQKYNPIVGNIGHVDVVIDLARLGSWKA